MALYSILRSFYLFFAVLPEASWSKYLPSAITRQAHDAYMKQQHQLQLQVQLHPQTANTSSVLPNEFHSLGSRGNASGSVAPGISSYSNLNTNGYTRSQSTHALPAASTAGGHSALGLVPISNASLLQAAPLPPPAPPPPTASTPSASYSAYRPSAQSSSSSNAYAGASGRTDVSRYDGSAARENSSSRARHLTEGTSRNPALASEPLTTNYSSRVTADYTSDAGRAAVGSESTSNLSRAKSGAVAGAGSSSSRYESAASDRRNEESAAHTATTSQVKRQAAFSDDSSLQMEAMVEQLGEFHQRQRTPGNFVSPRNPNAIRSAAAPTPNQSSSSPPRARTPLPNTASTGHPLCLSQPSSSASASNYPYDSISSRIGGAIADSVSGSGLGTGRSANATRPLPPLPQSSSVVNDELSDDELQPRVLNDRANAGAFTRGHSSRATSPAPGRRTPISNALGTGQLQLAPGSGVEDYTYNGSSGLNHVQGAVLLRAKLFAF